MSHPEMPEIINTPQGKALDVRVALVHGVHSRPSARIAQTARKYNAEVTISTSDGEVSASSMLDILSLTIPVNAQVRLTATGPEAEAALIAVGRLFMEPGV